MSVFVVLLLALCVAVFVATVVTIPTSVLKSHERYRLWQLRDQVEASIRHGELPDVEQSHALLEKTEQAIQLLDDLRLGAVLLSSRGLPELPEGSKVDLDRWMNPDVNAFTDEQREMYAGYRELRIHILIHHVLYSSWFGLFFAGLLTLFMLPLGFWNSLTQSLHNRRVLTRLRDTISEYVRNRVQLPQGIEVEGIGLVSTTTRRPLFELA